MVKMVENHLNLELAVVVGIDPNSEGLAMARARGGATTHEGIEGLQNLQVHKEIGIVKAAE